MTHYVYYCYEIMEELLEEQEFVEIGNNTYGTKLY